MKGYWRSLGVPFPEIWPGSRQASILSVESDPLKQF